MWFLSWRCGIMKLILLQNTLKFWTISLVSSVSRFDSEFMQNSQPPCFEGCVPQANEIDMWSKKNVKVIGGQIVFYCHVSQWNHFQFPSGATRKHGHSSSTLALTFIIEPIGSVLLLVAKSAMWQKPELCSLFYSLTTYFTKKIFRPDLWFC